MMDLPLPAPLDPELGRRAAALIDAKAKPPGALGRIEETAVRLAQIQGRCDPTADRPRLLVFAGDHGLTEDGVSSYPSAVTAAMVATYLAGKASANAFAGVVGAEMRVVDAGVAADLPAHPGLVAAKIRRGTRNAAREPALTRSETATALACGIALAQGAAADGVDLLALGEMGIGNTASAALLMHRLLPAPLPLCVGRGAGQSDEGLARKLAVLERAAARSAATEPLDVLAEFGGCEIVMMAGAVLGAAAVRLPVLVDGFICTAAVLAAVRLQPRVLDHCLFAHRSAEAGHRRLLDGLPAEPLLELDLRLGEGTGALLAIPLVRAAARLLTDVASLEEVLAGLAAAPA